MGKLVAVRTDGPTADRRYENEDGLLDIEYVKGMEYQGDVSIFEGTKDRQLGTFGIKGDDGREHLFVWKVDRHRLSDLEEVRMGCNEFKGSKYGMSLLQSMFAGW